VPGQSLGSCLPITPRRVSFLVKGRVYISCVQSVLMYGSENWPKRADLERSVRRTEKWICVMTL